MHTVLFKLKVCEGTLVQNRVHGLVCREVNGRGQGGWSSVECCNAYLMSDCIQVDR